MISLHRQRRRAGKDRKSAQKKGVRELFSGRRLWQEYQKTGG